MGLSLSPSSQIHSALGSVCIRNILCFIQILANTFQIEVAYAVASDGRSGPRCATAEDTET